MDALDRQVRITAFQWLEEQVSIRGDVLPRSLLRQGFTFRNERVPLVSPQGIFKPRVLDLPLSITTSPNGPYDDSYSDDGFLLYRYRGTDPAHRDNVGLRECWLHDIPLVYLHGVSRGKYVAVWPVYIIGDDPGALTFKVAVDDVAAVVDRVGGDTVHEPAAGRRAYVTAVVKRRLHQRSFRERVLQAYREQCALCRLRHNELLDAAHIIPDTEPSGVPVVTNGISLCKLHHAAFDRFIIGINPDYLIDVREDILEEEDGPMLQHGLKELHGQKIALPRRRTLRPDQELLEKRYAQFRAA